MNWHRLTVAGAIFATMAFPIATIGEASAQSRTPQCVMVTPEGDHILLTDPDDCPASVFEAPPGVRPTPVLPAPIVHSVVDPGDHQFELFNNSDQDIQYLHISPVSDPEDVDVYGGRRHLAPGRAWSVTLNQGCEYNLLVEFENGSRNYYEGIDTCDHRGIQLQ